MSASRPYGRDSPYPPLTSVHSRPNESFTIMWENSSDGTWNALGFVVDQVMRRYERIEGFATLADGGTLDFGIFGEKGHESNTTDEGADRLRIEENHDRRVIEYAVGVTPTDENLLVGVQNPIDAPIVGLDEQSNRLRNFDVAALTDRGGVASTDTITSDGATTTALSTTPDQGLVRIDTDDNGNNPMRFGFNNQTGAQQTLSAQAFGAAYDVTVIGTPNQVRNLLYSPDVRTLIYGGQGNSSPNLPRPWKSAVVEVTTDDAVTLGLPQV